MADCLNVMVAELTKNTRPGELMFSIYDGAESVFHFSPVAGRHRAIHASVAAAIRELEWAIEVMARRHEMLSSANCRTLDRYNMTHGDAPLPRIVIVIHELGDLMAADAVRTERMLVKLLSRRAQPIGIYVICSISRIRPDVLKPWMLTHFGGRLVFRTDSKDESELLGLKTSLFPKWVRPYRGNPATRIGKEIEKAEKGEDAVRLDADEAVFFYYDINCIGKKNGNWTYEISQRKRLVRMNDWKKNG